MTSLSGRQYARPYPYPGAEMPRRRYRLLVIIVGIFGRPERLP
jgi:hypothetical protein